MIYSPSQVRTRYHAYVTLSFGILTIMTHFACWIRCTDTVDLTEHCAYVYSGLPLCQYVTYLLFAQSLPSMNLPTNLFITSLTDFSSPKLYFFIDRDRNGFIDVSELLVAIKGDMNSKRTALVCCAFDLLDTDKYVQYSIGQYGTVQYTTLQYSTVQYTVQYSIVQFVILANACDEVDILPDHNNSAHSNRIMILTPHGKRRILWL